MPIHFITFGDEIYNNSKLRIKKEAESMNIFDSITIYDEDTLKNDKHFWDKHSEFISKNRRGYGYWIWKSYLILKKLEEIEIGDTLFYADAGCTLNPSGINKLNLYLDKLEKSQKKMISFSLVYPEKEYTKMDLFKYLNMTSYDDLNKTQLLATYSILKKTEENVEFVKKWYSTCCIYNLIDDSPSIEKNDDTFIEHRHDQSMYSLLAKQHGTEIIKDEGWHNDFKSEFAQTIPILATRYK